MNGCGGSQDGFVFCHGVQHSHRFGNKTRPCHPRREVQPGFRQNEPNGSSKQSLNQTTPQRIGCSNPERTCDIRNRPPVHFQPRIINNNTKSWLPNQRSYNEAERSCRPPYPRDNGNAARETSNRPKQQSVYGQPPRRQDDARFLQKDIAKPANKDMNSKDNGIDKRCSKNEQLDKKSVSVETNSCSSADLCSEIAAIFLRIFPTSEDTELDFADLVIADLDERKILGDE